MSNKGSKRFKEKDEWQQWVCDHQDLIDASGLPPLYVSTREHWDYFLDHGTLFYFEEDFPPFHPTTLLQESALVRLILLTGGLDTHYGRNSLVSLLEHIDNLPRKK